METANYFRCGFRLNSTVEATVRCIKDDRVRFSVTNCYGEECNAWFYIHGEHINPHQVYHRGTTIPVRVIRISKDTRRSKETIVEVRPEFLPVDSFLAEHPLGSQLQGRIEEINGSGMLVRLAENVFCLVKRIKTAKSGMLVFCKLSRYNANRKVLFATIL